MAPQKYIEIKGARVHNLKNVSLQIPRDSFTVLTGLSGSGKSSWLLIRSSQRVRDATWSPCLLMRDSS